MYDICDIHGHFLPGMDDGCRTVDESIKVLQASYAGGVRRMFATPHYYARETVEDFFARRDACERALRSRMAEHALPLPQFLCGAEVAYHSGISHRKDLPRLCLGNTRYLLLELPFTRWNSEVVRDLNNLCIRGYQPILAHIERYFTCQSRAALESVLELQPLVQMNAEYLLDFWHRRHAVDLLKKDVVQLLGSDCHNMTGRAPNLGQAVQHLHRKGLDTVLAQMEMLSDEIYREAAASDP